MSRLLQDIEQCEFGGNDFSEKGISTAWIKLPEGRFISARWYSSGQRSELYMGRNGEYEHVELPHDKWSEMILRAIIKKTRDHHNKQLEELLNV